MMLQENSHARKPDRRNDAVETSQLITRRSMVLGLLVALVPITALVVTVVGTLLTQLHRLL